MGLNEVIEQHAAGNAAGSPGMSLSATQSGGRQPGGQMTPRDAQSPSVSMMQNGEMVRLNAVTLILYGVALADLLLLYIALRV